MAKVICRDRFTPIERILTYSGHVVALEVLGPALLRDVVVKVATVRVHRAHVQLNVLVS